MINSMIESYSGSGVMIQAEKNTQKNPMQVPTPSFKQSKSAFRSKHTGN